MPRAGGEAVCVCDFEAMLDLEPSTVLRTAGMIERDQRGRYAGSSLADGALERGPGLLGHSSYTPGSASRAVTARSR